MQKFYFQDSFTIKKELDLQKTPLNARLFICDATSMYSNIRKGLALHRIGRFALDNEKYLTVPPAVLMDSLHLLMTNTIFQFGDTYWFIESGNIDGSITSAPLVHNLLRHPQRGSARSVQRQAPNVSLFYQ